MRFAVFESIMTPAGHELDFDRMLISGLQKIGCQVELFVPEKYPFKLDYRVPVRQLPGEVVSYAGASGVKKTLLTAKREIRRLGWFNALYDYAITGQVDAIIIPTATYRFLHSLLFSRLKESPIPVIFIHHGVNPREAARFFKRAKNLEKYAQIKIPVITLGDDLFGQRYPNVFCIKPPVFQPDCLSETVQPVDESPLVLGFFGQYRREKNLNGFLETFCRCRFAEPVKLLVQGATVRPEDAADFERIRQQYAHVENIVFLHKALLGKEWQDAIAGVDALIMPYAAERYLYHWSAMLFTAIGFHKSVVIANSINPEVLARYQIGVTFRPQEKEELKTALEEFVNTYDEKKGIYRSELKRANNDFAPERFVRSIIDLVR